MLTILKLASFYRKWGIIMGKYFGTDGVRGVAGADLTCELAMKIGRGAAAVLTGSTGHRPRILIGKDTRQSGDIDVYKRQGSGCPVQWLPEGLPTASPYPGAALSGQTAGCSPAAGLP